MPVTKEGWDVWKKGFNKALGSDKPDDEEEKKRKKASEVLKSKKASEVLKEKSDK